jgi:hypothetical protein
MALTRVNAPMFSPDTLILLAFCGGCALTAVATEEYLNYRASIAWKKLKKLQ